MMKAEEKVDESDVEDTLTVTLRPASDLAQNGSCINYGIQGRSMYSYSL